MFIYRDEKGKITDVRGSIDHAELERLKKEYGEVESGKAKGEVRAEPDLGPDPDTVKAFEEAKAPEPVPEPPEEEDFKSKSEFKSALDESGDPGESEETNGLPEKPGTSDNKAAWVDYAVQRGSDREEADSLTKQELIDFYKED